MLHLLRSLPFPTFISLFFFSNWCTYTCIFSGVLSSFSARPTFFLTKMCFQKKKIIVQGSILQLILTHVTLRFFVSRWAWLLPFTVEIHVESNFDKKVGRDGLQLQQLLFFFSFIGKVVSFFFFLSFILSSSQKRERKEKGEDRTPGESTRLDFPGGIKCQFVPITDCQKKNNQNKEGQYKLRKWI